VTLKAGHADEMVGFNLGINSVDRSEKPSFA
jgi:hypothetical protein